MQTSPENIRFGVKPPALVDPFGRAVTYIRVSVTDRCDFRCVYCMSEDMNFLPKRDLLTLEETGPRKHWLRLNRGSIDVRLWAPPGRVALHTPAGDVIDLGDRAFEVIHTPGHSPGGIGLLERKTGIFLSGDIVYDGPPSNLTAQVLTQIYGEEDWSATIRKTDEEADDASLNDVGDG